jgi:hypothetical protein
MFRYGDHDIVLADIPESSKAPAREPGWDSNSCGISAGPPACVPIDLSEDNYLDAYDISVMNCAPRS